MGKTQKKPELYHNSQTHNVLRNLMLRDCGFRTTHRTSTKEFEPLAETNFILKKLKELVSQELRNMSEKEIYFIY